MHEDTDPLLHRSFPGFEAIHSGWLLACWREARVVCGSWKGRRISSAVQRIIIDCMNRGLVEYPARRAMRENQRR